MAGGALVLRGEPGVGKTRLLSEATAIARDRGFTVLNTAGVQSEAQLAFAGLHQLLRPVRSSMAQLPEIHRASLDAAFGLREDAAPEPFRIAMAALDLLCEVATEAPLLIAADDIHWLDHPSTDALTFIARRVQSDPIVLLAATREGYSSSMVDSGLPEYRLRGLAPVAAEELLDSSAPQLVPSVRDRLLQEAGGNPLALIELPISAGNVLAVGAASLPLTDRLERAFAARASELPQETRLLLEVAALSPECILGQILAAASEIAGRTMGLEAVEPSIRASMALIDGDELRFRHPLIRSAVRQQVGLSESRRIHEALAVVLRDDADRRVWHRAALISGVHEDIACELEEAGARARRRGAIDVALTALQRAVELSGPEQRRRRMFAAAHLAYERGRRDVAVAMLGQIEHLDLTPVEVARARFINELLHARVLTDHSQIADLIATAERAGEAGDRELHHNLLWITSAGTFWSSRLRPETRQLVVDAANRAGPPVAADPRLVSIHAYADPIANASKVLDCLRDAATSGVSGAEPATYLAAAGLVIGAFYDSLTFSALAIDSARDDGRLGVLPRLLATEAILAARLPNWDIAIPAADEARRLATELNQPHWLAVAETAVAMIAAVRGDRLETEQATARAEQIALPLGASHILALAQTGPILSALADGRYDEAFQVAERLFDPRDPAHHLLFACLAIGDLAEAGAHAGRSSAARRRLADVEVIVGDAPPEWIAINLRHARAVLAEDDRQAAVRFDDALGADLGHWPFWRGRLLLAHGRWLRRRRRVTESRAPLREARDLFDAMGATKWGDQARSELRASGESSRRRGPAARDDLTGQELQIAQLAATGLSNRDIGQRLYLSHRTIGTHLYRVFPKLGITSRAELSAALASGSETR